MTGSSQTVRRLQPAEAAAAVKILIEAAEWSGRFGNPIWHAADFSEGEQRVIAGSGELFGGFVGQRMVACMRLQRADPIFWPHDPVGEALYLHKIAICRDAASTGWLGRLIAFAQAEAATVGAAFLRLDTLPRDRMIALYASHGFAAVDHEPGCFGGRWMIRMEKKLA